jgi:hypothetical protein
MLMRATRGGAIIDQAWDRAPKWKHAAASAPIISMIIGMGLADRINGWTGIGIRACIFFFSYILTFYLRLRLSGSEIRSELWRNGYCASCGYNQRPTSVGFVPNAG